MEKTLASRAACIEAILAKSYFYSGFNYQAEPEMKSEWEIGDEKSAVQFELQKLEAVGYLTELNNWQQLTELVDEVYTEYLPRVGGRGMVACVLEILPQLHKVPLTDLIQISRKSKHYVLTSSTMPGSVDISYAGPVLIEFATLAEGASADALKGAGYLLANASYLIGEAIYGLDLSRLHEARDNLRKLLTSHKK